MKVKTKFFGTVDLNDEDIIAFPEGIPGFEQTRRFMWYQPDNSAFSCLQAIDQPEVAFITVSPFLICPNYTFDLGDQSVEKLGLTKAEDALLLALVTIPEGDPGRSTANLKAPVIINQAVRRGYQIILNEDYSLREPLTNRETSKENKTHK